MLGGVTEESLPVMAAAFLTGYNRPAIWELAQSRLVIPTGFGRLWWASAPSTRRLACFVDASPCWANAWRPRWPPHASG
jgi:hypothetical protein